MLDDGMLKVKLYLAHGVRSLNQKRRCDEVKKGLTDKQALIILDFKTQYSTERRVYCGPEGGVGTGVGAGAGQDGEDESTVPEFDIFYFDHVLMCDTAQDAGSVVSIFESLSHRRGICAKR